ncbi:sugar transferase [Oceaniglobus indicus]|uniref:sugar transferase n=1 Tax=Oceaniglobus indicus TaxID=2047749 RepID=UPI001F4D7529|nr:sugar transferase [Oceaniglobus indicus]
MKDYLQDDIAIPPTGREPLRRNISELLSIIALRQPMPAMAMNGGYGAHHAAPQPPIVPVPPVTGKSGGWYARYGKRLLDVALVLLTAPVTLSIVALCAVALWIEGGNPFYRQDRLGAKGNRFRILKLRTMVRDADTCLQAYLDADPALRHEWATTQKLKNDPRITRVGAILRSTSLDELPQFWNVLTGEMSLVGPRPMMPDQLEIYGNPQDYFSLRPGITGFWQVSARNESHFSFRAEIDAQYRRNLSLWCDVRVMLRTVGVMVRRTGY